MRPTLFAIGDIPFPSYFTLLIGGFMLAVYLAWRDSRRAGIDPDDLLDLALYMLIAGLVGSRLLHVVADGYFWDYVHLCTDPLQVNVPSFMHVPCATDAECVAASAGALCHPTKNTCHPAGDCFAALKFWQGGLAFYGGFVLAVATAVVFVRRRKMGFLRTADLCAWGIALGLIFGRTGCLLAGCCFGEVTESPVGLEFPGRVVAASSTGGCPRNYDLLEVGDTKVCAIGSPALVRHAKEGRIGPGARHSLPVHPTQLYEAAFCLVLFLYLYFWRRKRVRHPGQAFAEMCVAYAAGRFVVELFRDDDRGVFFGDLLSTSQLIALPIFLAAAAFLWKNRGVHPATETVS